MSKVYGIFSGEYSDWNVHGYFTDKYLAERYCAKQNKNSDSYYTMELSNLQSDIKESKDLKTFYEHEVVFDYSKENALINEPYRFNCYTESEKDNNVIKTSLYGLITFSINTDSRDREKAEKIACDMYAQFKYLYSEFNSYKIAAIELSKITGYELQIK